jgi:hypothetical protein
MPLPAGSVVGRVSSQDSNPTQLSAAEERLLRRAGMAGSLDGQNVPPELSERIRQVMSEMGASPSAEEVQALQQRAVTDLPPEIDLRDLPDSQQAQIRQHVQDAIRMMSEQQSSPISVNAPIVMPDAPSSVAMEPENPAQEEQVEATITAEDRIAFIEAVWADKPFQKTYTLLDGNISILLQDLPPEQNDIAVADADQLVQSGEIATTDEYDRRVELSKLAVAVVRIQKGSEVAYSADGPQSLFQCVHSQSMLNMLVRCFREFQDLLLRLEEEASSENFM